MSENAWIEHDGGPMPVAGGTLVDVRFRDGDTAHRTLARHWGGIIGSDWWMHDGGTSIGHDADIIAYRLSGPLA